jgi:hypothetical protein
MTSHKPVHRIARPRAGSQNANDKLRKAYGGQSLYESLASRITPTVIPHKVRSLKLLDDR